MKEFNHGELSRLQVEINGGFETDENGQPTRKRVLDGFLNVKVPGISQKVKVLTRERSKDVSKLMESISDQFKAIQENVKNGLEELKKKYYQNPDEKDKANLVLNEGVTEADFKAEVKALQEQADKDVDELVKAKHNVEKIEGLDAAFLENIDCGVTGDFYEMLIELQKS
jgi:hypothetical protein